MVVDMSFKHPGSLQSDFSTVNIYYTDNFGTESLKWLWLRKTGLPSLKGQSNEIFDLQFFSYLELIWATD